MKKLPPSCMLIAVFIGWWKWREKWLYITIYWENLRLQMMWQKSFSFSSNFILSVYPSSLPGFLVWNSFFWTTFLLTLIKHLREIKSIHVYLSNYFMQLENIGTCHFLEKGIASGSREASKEPRHSPRHIELQWKKLFMRHMSAINQEVLVISAKLGALGFNKLLCMKNVGLFCCERGRSLVHLSNRLSFANFVRYYCIKRTELCYEGKKKV